MKKDKKSVYGRMERIMASSGGGGGVHFSSKNWEGGYNFYHKVFLGGSVLKHYTFLKTTAPPLGRNKRSVRYWLGVLSPALFRLRADNGARENA